MSICEKCLCTHFNDGNYCRRCETEIGLKLKVRNLELDCEQLEAEIKRLKGEI